MFSAWLRRMSPARTWKLPVACLPSKVQSRQVSVFGSTSGGEEGFRVWPNGGGLVHKDAAIDDSVVGRDSVIGSGSVLGTGVSLGAGCVLGSNVSLENCTTGERAILHPGVRIGQDGFGFYIDSTGAVVKKPQGMSVIIMDDVEIGANSCVDRGSWRETIIGDNTKIDNLVQIGHNVVIGNRCIICAHCAIGGSAELGDYVVMGGKAAVKDHVRIVSKVRIAAKAGVAQDIKEPGDYAGFPAVPASQWRRQVALRGRAKKRQRA